MSTNERLARRLIANASRIVGFTGAGISTESGIPDFRSSTGVWTRNPIVDWHEFISSEDARTRFWQLAVELWPVIWEARPNAGHDAFVALHRQGRLDLLITQNVDRLHQRAGLPADEVLELHGAAAEVTCLTCGDVVPPDEVYRRIQNGEPAPRCRRCSRSARTRNRDSRYGLLKPALILFGEELSEGVMQRAETATRTCDLLLAVGSSLEIEPAASIPGLAKDAGARLIIVNREQTPLDDCADVVLRGEIGTLLPRLVQPDQPDG